MNRLAATLSLIMLLVAIVIAPVQATYAATVSAQAPMTMQMNAGSPCLPKDCKSTPDCPMMVSGAAGIAVPGLAASTAFVVPALVSNGFAINQQRALSSLPDDGLRRPPKL